MEAKVRKVRLNRWTAGNEQKARLAITFEENDELPVLGSSEDATDPSLGFYEERKATGLKIAHEQNIPFIEIDDDLSTRVRQVKTNLQ